MYNIMKTHSLVIIILICFIHFAKAQGNYLLDTNGLGDQYESGPTEFELFDIDEDGDLDIITVGDHMNPGYTNEQGLIVFKNNGSGNAWQKIMSGGFGYGGIAVGDVNNDGYYDVAYGIHHNYGGLNDFGNQRLEVVLGNGTGYSWITWDDNLAEQGQTWGMFDCDFADIDNDGLLDLGANSFGSPDGVWIYKNKGNGFWEVMSGSLSGNSSNDFSFGDFNNDGFVDFISNNQKYLNQNGNVWYGDGSGNFYSMNTGFPLTYPTNYGFKFDISDFNRDGSKDIIITNNGGLYTYIYDTNTYSWIQLSTNLPTTGSYMHIAVGDLNADGIPDIAGVKSNSIVIFTGDTSGNWNATDTINTGSPSIYDIKIGDLDKNGFSDIVFWGKINGVNMVRVYRNTQVSNQLKIKSIYPNGKEIICGNSAQFIKWNRSVPQNSGSNVKIELSETGLTGNYSTIKTNITNSNTYQWITPKTESINCYLRLILQSNGNQDTSYSETAFTIKPCVRKPEILTNINGRINLCGLNDSTTLKIDSVYGATGYYWTYPQGWQGTANGQEIKLKPNSTSGIVSVFAYTAIDTSDAKSIFVTITNIDTTITTTDSSLTANETAPATYQWIDCQTNQPISGAINKTFIPTQGGNYAVKISKNGCLAQSYCYHNSTGINETIHQKPTVNPNPTSGKIEINHKENILEIQLVSVSGELIQNSNHNDKRILVDISNYNTGIYILIIVTENSIDRIKIIKSDNY